MKTNNHPIQLIVGLGNPGPKYATTRHNVGVWFVEKLAETISVTLRPEAKFHGLAARASLEDQSVWLFVPTTFMNESGQAVKAISTFYKIPPEAILIAHDELDFPVGQVRFKQGGGHGGHNGLRNIISHLHGNTFNRLRIGINHPGKKEDVTDYVLSTPSKKDQTAINESIDEAITLTPDIIRGHMEAAMKKLHSVLPVRKNLNGDD